MIVAGTVKAWRIGSTKVGAQRRVERIDVHEIVSSGIEPIGRAFFESAIGGEELHDVGDGGGGVIEDRGSTLRFVFRDCQRANGFSAVADLIPVVVLVMNRVAALNAFKPGVDALSGDCILDGRAVGG